MPEAHARDAETLTRRKDLQAVKQKEENRHLPKPWKLTVAILPPSPPSHQIYILEGFYMELFVWGH